MGSDRHYPEEAPAHRVSVDGFWIDRTPVTNSEFHRFVRTTGHVTVAELAPKAADYPNALSNMLRPGSLVFINRLAGLQSAAAWSCDGRRHRIRRRRDSRRLRARRRVVSRDRAAPAVPRHPGQ
jgi:formylglycine-generating enzyme required for sulfatase activity